MFTPFVLSQILAALGICTDVTGWQFKSRVTVLLFLVGSSFFFAAHFYVLGQSLSALATVIGAAGYVVSIFSPSRLAMCIFIGLVLGMFLFIGNLGVLPIFSLLAALFSTI